jgi:ornithine cyclodeaminase
MLLLDLTTLRTAAASAVATRALAREDSSRLAIVGCGEQARLHVDALCRIRPIRSIVIWNRTPERAAAFAGTLSSFDGEVDVMDSVREAIQHADIICTLTAASEPILFGRDLVPGQHLNIVGSSTKTPREIDDQAVARGRYIADSKAHASSQGAELISAISSGMVANDHLLGEIGEVLAGRVVGRLNEGDITLYKSLGHIIQDLAVADLAYKRWRARTP